MQRWHEVKKQLGGSNGEVGWGVGGRGWGRRHGPMRDAGRMQPTVTPASSPSRPLLVWPRLEGQPPLRCAARPQRDKCFAMENLANEPAAGKFVSSALFLEMSCPIDRRRSCLAGPLSSYAARSANGFNRDAFAS